LVTVSGPEPSGHLRINIIVAWLGFRAHYCLVLSRIIITRSCFDVSIRGASSGVSRAALRDTDSLVGSGTTLTAASDEEIASPNQNTNSGRFFNLL
jgi:hypothetical protein